MGYPIAASQSSTGQTPVAYHQHLARMHWQQAQMHVKAAKAAMPGSDLLGLKKVLRAWLGCAPSGTYGTPSSRGRGVAAQPNQKRVNGCPAGKVLNTETGKCVNIDGAVGRAIILKMAAGKM